MKLTKLSAADLCDLTYHFVVRNMDEKETRSYNLKLYMPPPGVEPEDDNPFWGEAAENEAFDRARNGKGIDRG